MIRNILLLLIVLCLNGCIMFISTSSFERTFTDEDGKSVQADNKGTDTVNAEDKKNESGILEIGRVASVNKGSGEVVVNQNVPVKMGDTVYVLVKDKKVFMKVTFPMQTVFKCTVSGGSKQFIKEIKKDMIVFKEK